MSNYTAEGVLQEIFATEQKTASFASREFILRVPTNNEQYPNYVKFQLVQDRCDLIEPYSEEDEIRVHFNLVGKKWQDKYFVNLTAWKIERTSQEVSRKPKEELKSQYEQKEAVAQEPNQGYDDLPF